MEDLLPTIVVVILGTLFTWLYVRPRYPKAEWTWIGVALGIRGLVSPATVWINNELAHGGDLYGYEANGRLLVSMLDRDFVGVAPLVIRLFIQQDEVLEPFVSNANTTTGSCSAATGMLMFLGGGSIYAASALVGFASLWGGILLYNVFRATLEPEDRVRAIVATMLWPTVVYWSSGVFKEALCFGPFCLMIYGVHRLSRGQWVVGFMAIAAGASVVAFIKPYILFALGIAAGAWLLWERRAVGAPPAFRMRNVLLAALVGVGGLVLLSAAFPEFAVESLPERTGRMQDMGRTAEGGSNYDLGAVEERSALGQLAFAPAALATTLYRPLIVEVHNGITLMNAFETSFLLYLSVTTIIWGGARMAARVFWRYPVLLFGAVFIAVFGTSIGLATSNLGTLSRYRLPLMPLFAVTLLVLHRHATNARRDGVRSVSRVERTPGGRSLPPRLGATHDA
jgi:hypothetical protein